jgi:ribosomal protein S18 acetylase RimI-like enzyme
MSLIKITTWYLDYQGPQISLPSWPQDVVLTEAELPSPELSQFLFCAVGHHWRWFSRLSWDYQQWQDYVCSAQVRTFVLYQKGTPAGFVELRQHDDLSVELKFFGLLPAFIGKGLGKLLAQAAIALAQQWQANRVWVHTCTEDHPSALKTYQQAGFCIVSTEEQDEEMPTDYAEAALARPYVWSRLKHFHTA